MQAIAPNKTLTVKRIFEEPGLGAYLRAEASEQFQWSADGQWVAYIQTTESGQDHKRSLWMMNAGSGERRLLVPADKLWPKGGNAKKPLAYRWAPDGQCLLLSSDTSLTLFDLKDGSSKDLITGSDTIAQPQFSPDGRWVSFVRGHNVWLLNLANGAVTALTKEGSEQVHVGEPDWLYAHEFELEASYWWAPDSSAIAYLKIDDRPVSKYPIPQLLKRPAGVRWQQYPEAGGANPVARVFVTTLADRKPREVDGGENSDVYVPRVQWLPDSKHVAIERMNRAQSKLDLLIANAATGRSETVLTERDPYWINVKNGLHFLSDGHRFLWLSERSGYRHLYLYDIEGREIRQLTRGRWEVCQLAAVDETGQFIYFTATEKSPIEQHLYRIGLDNSGLKRITHADGWHSVNFSPRGQAFIDAYSNAMTPPRQGLMHADGSIIAPIYTTGAKGASELSSYARSPVEFMTVATHDNATLDAMMMKPVGFDPRRKYPVIVFMNGGPRQQGVRNAWEGWVSLWHEMMAEKGFLIFALDNRGSAGHGHLFEEPLHYRLGAQEISDQRDGVAYLRKLPYVDASRIGVWGMNYGGQLALHAMFEDPQDFKAGFAQSPISDWRLYRSAYAERYLGPPKMNSEEYQESSPITTAAQLQGKLLVAASMEDEDIHFANTLALQRALIDAGKYAEIITFPGQPDGITAPEALGLLFRRVTEFFVENLK